MESLSGKIGTFKAQFQELSNVTFNSDFIKAAVDAGTDLLTLLTEIIDTIGLFPALLGGIGIGSFIKNFA